MENEKIINWLLEGDVSIQYQVHRDLLSVHREDLRNRIASEGWGFKYLSFQKGNGHWGRKFYQPKWTSTHYTLLDLKNLGISPKNPKIRRTIIMLLEQEKGEDGGINPSGTIKNSDVCLNGMFLNYASYFEIEKYVIFDNILLTNMNSRGGVSKAIESLILNFSSIYNYQKISYLYFSK